MDDSARTDVPAGAPRALGALVFGAFAVVKRLGGGYAAQPDTPARRIERETERADERDPGHGRSATEPREIPLRGWRDILLRLFSEISRTNMSLIAAGLAFYGFLAIPSAFTALVSLYGLVFNPGDVERQIQGTEGLLPGQAVQILSTQLHALTERPPATLGIGLIISLALALWSARSATSSLITALNVAYEENEQRSFLRFQMAAIGLTVGAVLFAVISLALIAVLPAVIEFLPFGSFGKTIASIVRWPVLGILIVVGLAAIYRFAPCRAEPRWRWVSWGAVGATILWLIASALFSVYVGEFASYDKTYGSLGSVVVLLMWLYLSSFAVLLGAELNAEMEHQTARDSTTGKPEPMGARDARMADTLGERR